MFQDLWNPELPCAQGLSSCRVPGLSFCPQHNSASHLQSLKVWQNITCLGKAHPFHKKKDLIFYPQRLLSSHSPGSKTCLCSSQVGNNISQVLRVRIGSAGWAREANSPIWVFFSAMGSIARLRTKLIVQTHLFFLKTIQYKITITLFLFRRAVYLRDRGTS